MRNTKQRVAAVKQRAAQIEKKKTIRFRRAAGIAAIAACLAILVGLGLAMPGIVGTITAGNYAYTQTTASIFDGSSGIGYIVISLLAFVLGICVTILGYKIHHLNHENENHSDTNDPDTNAPKGNHFRENDHD